MADMKQCDRCGGYYGGTNHHFFKSSGKWRVEEYDLCDDCFKELGEFMCGVKPKNLLERIWRMMYKEE